MQTSSPNRGGTTILSIACIGLCACVCLGAAHADETQRTLTLGEIERIVMTGNHDIRLARIAVDGAQAGVAQADTAPNPTVSWNAASYSPTSGLGNGNVFGKRVDQILRIDQTVERGGKRALRVAVAESQLAGRKLDLEEQRRESLQAVRDAYVDLLLAEQRLDVLAETGRSYDAALDAATKRVKAGDLATADLARLKVDALRATTDAESAAADRRHAQVALGQLLVLDGDPRSLRTDGQWPDAALLPTDAGGAAPTSQRHVDVAWRPDVASARLAVEAAETSVDLARAQRWRDITFGLQVERYPGPLGTGNTVGVGVSVPLFTGNDYRGDMAHAVSDREAAGESAAKIRDGAIADTESAWADLETAQRRMETYRGGLLDAAASAAQSADFAFERGALGIMDLMDSRRTLLSTRLDALAARADYAKALIAVAAVHTRVSVEGRRR